MDYIVKTNFKISILVALFFISILRAEFSIDVCRFKGEGNNIYVELYLDLPRSTLTHYQTPEGWYGALQIEVNVFQDTTLVATDSWTIKDLVENPKQITTAQRLIDGRVYVFATGDYLLIVEAQDSISSRKWQQSLPITVETFNDQELSISDIEFSSYILPAGEHPRFDRGECTIIPNPRRLFGNLQPFLITYFEIYPPVTDSQPSIFNINRWITDVFGETILTLPTIQITGGPESFADIDTVNLKTLSTGSWTLNIEVRQNENEKTAFKSQRFFVYQPDNTPTITPSPRIKKLDSLAIENEFKEVEFLLTKSKITISDDMNLEDKGKFLEAFWRRYDDDPSTPEVPARNLFHKRVIEADERWNNSRMPGHKTDRGRIYSLYGEPDEKEMHPHDIHAKPYEIWSYHKLKGGTIFIFVDRSGFGEYTLVHSNLPGEVYNEDWYENYVIKSGTDSGR